MVKIGIFEIFIGIFNFSSENEIWSKILNQHINIYGNIKFDKKIIRIRWEIVETI